MNNLRKVTLFTAPSRRNSKQRSAHARQAQMLSIRDPGTKRHTSAQSRSVLPDWKAPRGRRSICSLRFASAHHGRAHLALLPKE